MCANLPVDWWSSHALPPAGTHNWLVHQLKLTPWPLLLTAVELSQKVQTGVYDKVHQGSCPALQVIAVGSLCSLLMHGLEVRQIGLSAFPVLQSKPSRS